jgi:hypothetical protein
MNRSRLGVSNVALLTTSIALAMACGKSEGIVSNDGGGSLGAGGNVGAGGVFSAGGSNASSGGSVGAGGSGGVGCVPDYACAPTAPNTGDIYADCVTRVNQFRACVCLPPLARWNAGEACADQDAQYDSQSNVAHAGFQGGICVSGNAQDECPGWKNATQVIAQCLQQMFAEGPPPSTPCTGTCYSAHGHYINMTGTNYKNGVACGFYTTSAGAMWAAQNFK